MKGGKHGHLHIGTASIILIFLTLCLVSFAVLSFVNANADLRLSRKLADRTRAYYEAMNEAEAFMAEMDEKLRGSGDDIDPDAFSETISAEFPIGTNEIQSLRVVLIPTVPESEDDPCFRIAACQVVNDESGLIYDETLDVMR